MYRITLTDDQLHELNRRAHQPGVAPSTRDRLEMVRLSHIGWSVPRIARHLGQHEQTVRRWVSAFLTTANFEALVNQPHLGLASALTPALLEQVRAELRKSDRTWTGPQLTEWLATEHQVRLSADRVCFHLKRARIRYKRSARSLKHKQDPLALEASKASLAMLKGGHKAGLSTCVTSTKPVLG
jgi:transposase